MPEHHQKIGILLFFTIELLRTELQPEPPIKLAYKLFFTSDMPKNVFLSGRRIMQRPFSKSSEPTYLAGMMGS